MFTSKVHRNILVSFLIISISATLIFFSILFTNLISNQTKELMLIHESVVNTAKATFEQSISEHARVCRIALDLSDTQIYALDSQHSGAEKYQMTLALQQHSKAVSGFESMALFNTNEIIWAYDSKYNTATVKNEILTIIQEQPIVASPMYFILDGPTKKLVVYDLNYAKLNGEIEYGIFFIINLDVLQTQLFVNSTPENSPTMYFTNNESEIFLTLNSNEELQQYFDTQLNSKDIILNENYLYTSVQLNNQSYQIHSFYSKNDITFSVLGDIVFYTVITAIVMLFIFSSTYYLSYLIARPIETLLQATRSSKPPVPTSIPFPFNKELSETVNQVVDSIQSTQYRDEFFNFINERQLTTSNKSLFSFVDDYKSGYWVSIAVLSTGPLFNSNRLDYLIAKDNNVGYRVVDTSKMLHVIISYCDIEKDKDDFTNTVSQDLSELINTVEEGYIGISLPSNSISTLSIFYSQANEALKRRVFDDKKRIFLYDELVSQTTSFDLDGYQNSLINIIVNEKKDDWYSVAEELSNRVSSLKYHEAIMTMATVLCRAFRELNKNLNKREEPWQEYSDIYNKLMQCNDRNSLITYLVHELSTYKQDFRFSVNNLNVELNEAIGAYIKENYFNPGLDIDSIAAQFGLSRSYFSKIFNGYFKSSFPEFLNDVRLKKAAELLSTTNMSVSEIGVKVGFSGNSYFTALFKKKYHISPTVYRKHNS